MNAKHYPLVGALTLALLSGCSEQVQQHDALTYTLYEQGFITTVPAHGELIAAHETVITTPMNSRGPQTLEWLKEEYSVVKKGEIIARFDGTFMERDRRTSENKQAISGEDIEQKQAQLAQQQGQLVYDMDLLTQERKFAKEFSIDDIRIRSKLEILESMQNVEFLDAKSDYFSWQKGQFADSAGGELDLLNMQRKEHSDKIARLNANLSSLEVVAPHDGLLTHQANWRGEKPKPGETLWPGQKIAALPDTSSMQVKLYVSEREALELAPEQEVLVTTLAYPEQPFKAKVASVSPMPKSIERGDPRKYFEVLTEVITTNTDVSLQPGLKVTALITTKPEQTGLVVPRQAIFSEQQKQFVFVDDGNQWRRQEVSISGGNLSLVEIKSGLTAGDTISLINRDAS
ncbi:efflux RND transporter periplasmic adaptor subunit [Pseudoalteromonas sp. GB56]